MLLLLKTVPAAPGSVCVCVCVCVCVYVCARACGLAARLSPEGALSLLFGGSSTGSPPSHRMGFERNKDSFLRIIRVSKGSLRMIIHFLKTTCAALVPLDAASVLRPGSCYLQLETGTLS